MATHSKRVRAIRAKVDRDKLYPVSDALGLVKECAGAKFDESVDVAVNLGIDAKKSDQVVRGSVVLPAGTGKTIRVAVFIFAFDFIEAFFFFGYFALNLFALFPDFHRFPAFCDSFLHIAGINRWHHNKRR